MAYTNNVPQGNQQIATTQPIIQANFGFLATSIGQEHNFNASGDGTDTYHKFVSMPNRADPSSLPAGTNGQYYVSGGVAKYYNGTNSFILNQYTGFLTGSFVINSSGAVIIASVPANVLGTGIVFKAGAVGTAVVMPFTFFTDGTKCYAFSNRIKVNGSSDDYPIEMDNSNAALNIVGTRFSSSWNGSYNFQIWYR